MKMIRTLIMLIAPLCVMACGDDSNDDNTKGTAATLTSSVPAIGATGVAATTTEMTLTFSEEINFVSGVTADFNGTSVGLMDFSKSGSVMTLTLPAALEKSKSYTLSVPEGFFTTKSNGASVAAFSITFQTEEKVAYDKSNISTSLVTENPMASTKKIYDYLLENYGEKTLSASMANVAWNLNEAELVYSATGKYPAIATMDYIHLFTQRSDWNSSWKVKYDDITEIQKWADNGGLVAASWHWMVPVTKGDIPTSGDGKLATDLTTAFMPSNMFIDGTWEKEIHDTELPILAADIKKLQDAGITLIFRPFHEASGNVLSGGDAWFWWGREGAEVYKKVWIDLFNYFKEQGINNIIWVWTTQTGYGWDATKGVLCDSDWYPGDEYVDIIGRDAYTKSATDLAAEYEAMRENFPHKIVTLSECGSVGKISEQMEKGIMWSWVMPWYQYDATTLDGHEHADTDWWKDAMSNENVISRDQLPSFK